MLKTSLTLLPPLSPLPGFRPAYPTASQGFLLDLSQLLKSLTAQTTPAAVTEHPPGFHPLGQVLQFHLPEPLSPAPLPHPQGC